MVRPLRLGAASDRERRCWGGCVGVDGLVVVAGIIGILRTWYRWVSSRAEMSEVVKGQGAKARRRLESASKTEARRVFTSVPIFSTSTFVETDIEGQDGDGNGIVKGIDSQTC